MPLHGGPPLTSTATVTVRTKVHGVLQRIIDRGIADGTLHPDVTPQDVVVFGAMPAQPRPPTSAGTPPVGVVWRGLRR